MGCPRGAGQGLRAGRTMGWRPSRYGIGAIPTFVRAADATPSADDLWEAWSLIPAASATCRQAAGPGGSIPKTWRPPPPVCAATAWRGGKGTWTVRARLDCECLRSCSLSTSLSAYAKACDLSDQRVRRHTQPERTGGGAFLGRTPCPGDRRCRSTRGSSARHPAVSTAWCHSRDTYREAAQALMRPTGATVRHLSWGTTAVMPVGLDARPAILCAPATTDVRSPLCQQLCGPRVPNASSAALDNRREGAPAHERGQHLDYVGRCHTEDWAAGISSHPCRRALGPNLRGASSAA